MTATPGPPPAPVPPRRNTAVYLVLLAAAALVVFIALDALPLTEPDEVFYAATAREMLAAPSPLTPLLFGRPQFEKPPLTYWLLAGSFALFGEHAWSARLVPATFGLLGALAVFLFGRRVLPDEVAALGALLLLTSLAWLGQAMAVLTDTVFSSLLAGAAFSFLVWYEERRPALLHGFAALAGLAVLAKGPVALALLLPAAVLFLRLRRDGPALRAFLVHPWWLVLLAVAGPWYLWAALVHGRAFTWEFLVHDNLHRIVRAEHPGLDRGYLYPVVVLVGTLPWTGLLAFLGAGFRARRATYVYLLTWIGTVLALFTLCRSKLPSYVLPLFPALALLLAASVHAGVASFRRRAAAAAAAAVGGAALLAAALPGSPLAAAVPFFAAFRPVVLAGGAWGAALFVVAGLLLSGRIAAAVALNTAGLLAVVLVASRNVPEEAVRAFTSADVPAFVARYHLEGETIVASKASARGVHYASGNPVVVMDGSKHPFWSDHPLEVIATDAEVAAFFAPREKVLCVVRPSDVERLDRVFGGARTLEVLSSAHRRNVVLSRRR